MDVVGVSDLVLCTAFTREVCFFWLHRGVCVAFFGSHACARGPGRVCVCGISDRALGAAR